MVGCISKTASLTINALIKQEAPTVLCICPLYISNRANIARALACHFSLDQQNLDQLVLIAVNSVGPE